jgi:hypothetical protein
VSAGKWGSPLSNLPVVAIAAATAGAGTGALQVTDPGQGTDVRLTPALWLMLLLSLLLLLTALLPEGPVYRASARVGRAFTVSRVALVGCALALTVGVGLSLAMAAM